MKKKVVILITVLALMAPVLSYWLVDESEVSLEASFKAAEVNPDMIVTDKFISLYNEWKEEGITENNGFYTVVFPADFDASGFSYDNDNNPNGYDPLVWDTKDSFSIEVTVPERALYQVLITYYSLTNDIRPIEISVDVNGERQYYESGQISLETYWVTPHEFNLDRYGNDILPSSEQLRKWNTTRLEEIQNLYENGLLFKLDEGINTITFNKTRGELLVGAIEVQGITEPITYEEYLGSNHAEGDYIEEYESELLFYKNSPAIQIGSSRSAGVTPFALVEKKLNLLDGGTYNRPGQRVYYEIEVPEDGYYQISLKYLQDGNQDVIVYRSLLIDGNLPFIEARQIPFKYTRKWKNQTLGNLEGEPYLFNLTKGTHTITLEASEYQKRDLYYALTDVLLGINNLVLEINKLTGRNVDPNRDWDITTYLPNLQRDLNDYADILKAVYEEWQIINQTKKNTLVTTTLKQSYEKLAELALEPNKIPAKIGQLSGNTGSIIESLGIILPTILNSPLSIDRFYVHESDAKLPKANVNFFRSAWIGVKRFFMSFFIDSEVSKRTPETLEVWVARSRQYVDLMQRMVDEDFSPNNDIKVNISMMPSQDKLILSNSAGRQPDIAMGIDAWRPYEFAIRNAALDLREFDDFSEVASRFARGSFLQLIYDEGVYALPDTQNFQILFYRKDIMDNLQLPIPETWEDVTDILPELQRYGMNFYTNLAGTGSFKGFGATMPFIYQYGGKIYEDDAFSAGFNDPKTIEAITFMTELFTVYALPIEVGSFYNKFRDGELPIGIGDFGMYVQLIHAAPEIAGLWEIAPMPGIEKDGVIDRSFVGAATSNMIFSESTHKDEAWEFMKWWSRTDIQIQYAEQLIQTMGPSYMWNTSNVEAFEQYSWDESHKEVIVSQWDYAYDVPKIPGSYMLEREISNIWNKTVYQGANVRTAIEDGLIIANKEITRKMIEFGYLDKDGTVLKPYLLPTIETIGWWIDE